jgi:hypothetical protein
MKEFDLVDQFKLVRRRETTPSDVEDLKVFFRERYLSNHKIADALECKPQQISMWFNGLQTTPVKWKAELNILKQMFIDWENAHGYQFNSEEHLLTVNTVCPYAEHGLRFSYDYNGYDVCDNCNIKLKCLDCHTSIHD